MGTYTKTIPKVYVSPSSPPSVAVMMIIKHLGIEVDLVEVIMATGEHRSPQFLKLNPQHAVPALNDDGYVLADSHVIMAYLVEMYGKDDSFYPSSHPKLKAMIDQRLHFNSGTLQARCINVFAKYHMKSCQFNKYFEQIACEKDPPDITSPEYALKSMIDAYNMMDKFVTNQQFMACNNLTIADFAIISTVTNASLLVEIDPVRFPNLTRWINLMKSLPCYELIKIGLEDMKSLMHVE